VLNFRPVINVSNDQTRVTAEQLLATLLCKKFCLLYWICHFVAVFTRARHTSLEWASYIQPTYTLPTYLLDILVLFFNLWLVLFPSALRLTFEWLYIFILPMRATYHLTFREKYEFCFLRISFVPSLLC